MNRNGRCAMGIDDFALVAGKNWWDLWPEEAQPLIRDAVAKAQDGEHSRFEAFCPTAKGDPRWWDVRSPRCATSTASSRADLRLARYFRRHRRAQLRETTAAEMRHRLQKCLCADQRDRHRHRARNAEREASRAKSSSGSQRLGIAQSLLLDGDAIGTRRSTSWCGD